MFKYNKILCNLINAKMNCKQAINNIVFYNKLMLTYSSFLKTSVISTGAPILLQHKKIKLTTHHLDSQVRKFINFILIYEFIISINQDTKLKIINELTLALVLFCIVS